MKSQNKRVSEGKKEKKTFKRNIFLILIGGVIGFINGFFGGGGGVVGVPILEKKLKISNKQAHATCLALILPLSIISSGMYVFSGVIETSLFLSVGAGVLLGGISGAFLLKILPEKIVRAVFALILFVGGLRLIIW